MKRDTLYIIRNIYNKTNLLSPLLPRMSNPSEDSNSSTTEGASVASNSSSDGGATSISIESLRRYLAEKLGFLDKQKPEKVKVLDNVTFDGIVEYIKSDKCKNIITMAGAGISTSAGIPDFRSPGTGLYDNLQKYDLPHPQAIFEITYFKENPKPFFVLAKELYPGSFKPTICHYFVKLLDKKGFLLRHYTQNIDTLERVAGISETKLVEAHGTFYIGHCTECDHEYSLEWMKERIFKDEIPICEECPGIVKPDITFFGDNLPEKFHKSIKVDFPKCDLLIILGSSLVVQPFASLIDRVPAASPRLLINREKAGVSSGLMDYMGIGGGLEFDYKDNSRDVFWMGDCDDGCQLLAEKLGWGDELKKLVEEEHKRIDDEDKKQNNLESQNELGSNEEEVASKSPEKHHL